MSRRDAAVPPAPAESGAAETDAIDQVGPAFKATVAAMRRLRGQERRHPGELRDAQYSLLFCLSQGGPTTRLSSSELAHQADLSPAASTELLDELETEGLVTRLRSDTDRRVVLVSLTERGHQAVRGRRQRMEPRWRGALSQFSDEDLMAAVAVLGRLREFFEELAAEG
jgi:DNA-binding MarR family transcriptional regulator